MSPTESEQSGQADLAFGASGKEIYVFDYRVSLLCIATSTWQQCVQTAVAGLSGDLGPGAWPGARLIDRNTLFVDGAGNYVGIFCVFSQSVNHKFRFFDADPPSALPTD